MLTEKWLAAEKPEMHGVRTPSPITMEVPRMVIMKSMILIVLLLSIFSLIM